MQVSPFDPLLEDAVAEVLESMCFLSTAGELTSPMEDESSWIGRIVEFRGPMCGVFGLRAPHATAHMMAANFLGEEDEVNDTQAAEALGELTNIVCGVLLGRVESKQTFDLSAPRADRHDPVSVSQGRRISRTIALDEGQLTVWLEVHPGE